MAKKRTRIPATIAARVLFEHDRTCCVCRQRGKPVQIHHLDADPSSHEMANLTVLCFDCHRETQIVGGFDRKLDADQLILFRDDWLRLVRRQRAADEDARELLSQDQGRELEIATSVAETLRENEEYELLAMHYNAIGNVELRDKYIEQAIQADPSDQTVSFLRGLQGKPELIPHEVVQREMERYTRNEDWTQRARFLARLGRHQDAITDYVRGILESLEDGNAFSAAFYLKELYQSDLLEELFVVALKKAEDDGDLWWQVRALDELEWTTELDALLLAHEQEIEASRNPSLQVMLARAKGDVERSMNLRKEIASGMRFMILGEDEDDDLETNGA